MDDGVIVGGLDGEALSLEELVEVFPVVDLFVQFKAVVILVHLDIFRVIPAKGDNELE
jgi:hypothetical protein